MFGIALQQSLCPTLNGCAGLVSLHEFANAAIVHVTSLTNARREKGNVLKGAASSA